MKHAPDMQDPVVDEFAGGLHAHALRNRGEGIPELEGWPADGWRPWWLCSNELRDVFRARARQMLAGDLSVMPWTYPPGVPA